MFAFNLKKTNVWVTMALLLLLSFTICPHSCYPHAEEDDKLTGAMENVDNAEDYESVQDNNDEEDEEDLTEDTDVDNDATSKSDCTANGSKCDQTKKCCDGLDGSPFFCVKPGKSDVYLCVKG